MLAKAHKKDRDDQYRRGNAQDRQDDLHRSRRAGNITPIPSPLVNGTSRNPCHRTIRITFELLNLGSHVVYGPLNESRNIVKGWCKRETSLDVHRNGERNVARAHTWTAAYGLSRRVLRDTAADAARTSAGAVGFAPERIKR